MESTQASADVFHRSWNVYRKFVRHDWMCHRAVYGTMRELVSRWFDRPFSVADFGCGDGSSTLDALSDLPLQRYMAVDRVGLLLEAVAGRLKECGCEVTLHDGDLAEVVGTPPQEPVDLVLCAFSLHHLNGDEKQSFLRHVRSWLQPQGRLVLVDLLRRPAESRLRYLVRFHRHASGSFGAFTADERALVREHMEACDFPETLQTLCDMLTSSGFVSPRLAFRDRNEFYGVLTSRPE